MVCKPGGLNPKQYVEENFNEKTRKGYQEVRVISTATPVKAKLPSWESVRWCMEARRIDLYREYCEWSDSFYEIGEWFEPPAAHQDRLALYKSQFVQPFPARTLTQTGWGHEDALNLLAHLGREKLNAVRNRDFQCAHLYPIDRLGNLEYVQLVYNQRAAFLTVDIDQPGQPGGNLAGLNTFAKQALDTLAQRGYCPNWLGINPVKGTAQAIWYIDPVYTDGDPTKPNRHMRLYKTLCKAANALLGADTSFSHRIMRNPLYGGNNPGAYRWNAYHHEIFKMRGLLMVIDELTGTERYTDPSLKPSKTGRELIAQAEHNRKQAENWRKLAQELDGMSIEQLEANDPDLIQGVRLVYMNNGTIARDVTAFRHALKIAYRLRKKGQRLSDNAVIDAYIHAYTVAQDTDQTGRAPEIPDLKSLQTLARRVRAYVTHNSTQTKQTTPGLSPYQYTTPAEKSALRTFGKRGGKESAARKWADRGSALARKSLEPLEQANQRRMLSTDENKGRVLAYISQQRREGHEPTTAEIAEDLSLSPRRVREIRNMLGMSAKRGRPKRN